MSKENFKINCQIQLQRPIDSFQNQQKSLGNRRVQGTRHPLINFYLANKKGRGKGEYYATPLPLPFLYLKVIQL